MNGVIATIAPGAARNRHHARRAGAIDRGRRDRARAKLAAISRRERFSWWWSTPAWARRGCRSQSQTRAGARFVGPDNGVLSLALEEAGPARAVELRIAALPARECECYFSRPRHFRARRGASVARRGTRCLGAADTRRPDAPGAVGAARRDRRAARRSPLRRRLRQSGDQSRARCAGAIRGALSRYAAFR